jgi:predicted RNA binding protein YcfA (HicA-like mRNA interferase family)
MQNREIIRILKQNGWQLTPTRGSHHQFQHPDRAGTVTVTHPRKDVPLPTIRSIEGQAGLKLLKR